MNFKDQIANDIASVFINPDEFGEPKMVDGVKLMVVVDNDIINERPRLYSTGEDPYATGVFRSMITFFVRKEALGYTPVEGQDMRFGDVDGKDYPYFVTSVSENMGLLEITIEANQS